MSKTAIAFFAFLVLMIIFSTTLGYTGIDRLHRLGYPPFDQGGAMYSVFEMGWHPSEHVILFLDSMAGKVLVWTLAMAVPAISGLVVFKYDRWILGFTTLFLTTVLYSVVGICLLIHGQFDAF